MDGALAQRREQRANRWRYVSDVMLPPIMWRAPARSRRMRIATPDLATNSCRPAVESAWEYLARNRFAFQGRLALHRPRYAELRRDELPHLDHFGAGM